MKAAYPLTVLSAWFALTLLPKNVQGPVVESLLLGSPQTPVLSFFHPEGWIQRKPVTKEPLTPFRLETIYLQSLNEARLLSWTSFERKEILELLQDRLDDHAAKYIHETLFYHGQVSQTEEIRSSEEGLMGHVFRISGPVYLRMRGTEGPSVQDPTMGHFVLEIELGEMEEKQFSVSLRLIFVPVEGDIFSRSLDGVTRPAAVEENFSQGLYRVFLKDFSYELTRYVFGSQQELSLHYEKGLYHYTLVYFLNLVPDLSEQIRKLIEVFPKSEMTVSHDV